MKQTDRGAWLTAGGFEIGKPDRSRNHKDSGGEDWREFLRATEGSEEGNKITNTKDWRNFLADVEKADSLQKIRNPVVRPVKLGITNLAMARKIQQMAL